MLQILSICGHAFAIFPSASLSWDSEKAASGFTVYIVELPNQNQLQCIGQILSAELFNCFTQ